MRALISTAAFRRDYKRLVRSGASELPLLEEAVDSIAKGAALPGKFRDHPLDGPWGGFRECHLKHDLLLVYRFTSGGLALVRLGSHSELFD